MLQAIVKGHRREVSACAFHREPSSSRLKREATQSKLGTINIAKFLGCRSASFLQVPCKQGFVNLDLTEAGAARSLKYCTGGFKMGESADRLCPDPPYSIRPIRWNALHTELSIMESLQLSRVNLQQQPQQCLVFVAACHAPQSVARRR